MRPYPLALALAAVAASIPTSARAYQRCVAVPVPPHFNPSTGRIEAAGSFTCEMPVTGMIVTICIQQGSALGGGWTAGCATSEPQAAAVQTVKAEVGIRPPISSAVFTSTATGTNDRGDFASLTSPPVPWVNCACYP